MAITITRDIEANIHIGADELATKAAHESNLYQGEFFNKFYSELRDCCRSYANAQLQLAHICDELNADGKELINSLHALLEAKKED